jgi:hypothetical protein
VARLGLGEPGPACHERGQRARAQRHVCGGQSARGDAPSTGRRRRHGEQVAELSAARCSRRRRRLRRGAGAQEDDDLELDQAAFSLTACIGKGRLIKACPFLPLLNRKPQPLNPTPKP